MRKIVSVIIIFSILTIASASAMAKQDADVCRTRCRIDEGVICLERDPCAPENEYLLKTAKDCREEPVAKYMPITKLLFVDILSQVIRLDKEFAQNVDRLTDEERYILKAELLERKGIDIFVGTKPLSPLTREELAAVLKNITIEKYLGLSSGLPGQMFDLKNDEFIVYDVEIYADEGKGFEAWERKKTFEESESGAKHYVAKLDSCDAAMVVFGDNEKGKIPETGSRLKTVYKFFGRDDEMVTECEVAMLLSDPDVARALKDKYNPSRLLTKANFVDLLIKTRHIENQLPRNYVVLTEDEIYRLQTEILWKHGIDIFVGTDPDELLTREELARVLYDSPVQEIIGISDGSQGQSFELKNAGFIIYDLHTYVDEGSGYEEWYKKESFFESSLASEDYLVRLDSGNYASVYFGDDKQGKIPAVNSPIRVTYRLYAPVAMITEDDIICVLGRIVPVAETYIPPMPPPEFPPPTDGYDDPASHY
ncbi:MAG: hypothetical protein KKD11_03685 [Candidatus Omnitrophica bacterium]|nr:hypothetical protein [Candidatus Omnitrophota bacterium]